MLYWSGHFDEAGAEFLHAKMLNPARDGQLNKNLALVLIQQYKYAEAEQLLLDADSNPHRDKVLAMAFHARDTDIQSTLGIGRAR